MADYKDKNYFIIRCNPYTQTIEYKYYNSETGEFCNPDDSSDLAKDEFRKAVLWNKGYEIVSYINEKYNNGNAGMEIIFEGTEENYEFLKEIIDKYFSDNKGKRITVVKGENTLRSPEDVKTIITGIFNELKPLFGEYNDSNISYSLNKYTEAIKTTIPVCVIGTYSAGKSAFINSLLGVELLPSASTPTTAKIYKISYGEEYKIKFSDITYGLPIDITLTFIDDTYKVDATAESSILTELETITDYATIEERMYNALRIINSHDPSSDFSDLIEVTMPIESPVLRFDKYDFVFYDTPGSNSDSNEEHLAILKNSLREQTNGLPVFVTTSDSMDSGDTSILTKTLNELGDALDKRNLIVVCNKSDEEAIDELRKKKQQYKKQTISKLDPAGIYFVSSPMGLGFKKLLSGNTIVDEIELPTGDSIEMELPRILNSTYMQTFKARMAEFKSKKNPKSLYKYNIVSLIASDKYNGENVPDDYYAYRNSGIHAVEYAINEFAEKYALYNKCNNATRFLEMALERLGRKIAEEKSKQESISQKLSSSLTVEQKNLIDELTRIANTQKKSDKSSFREQSTSIMNANIDNLEHTIADELLELKNSLRTGSYEKGIFHKITVYYIQFEKVKSSFKELLNKKVSSYWKEQTDNADKFWPEHLDALKAELIKIIVSSDKITEQQKSIIQAWIEKIKSSFAYSNNFTISDDTIYERDTFLFFKKDTYTYKKEEAAKMFIEKYKDATRLANIKLMDETTSSYDNIIKDIERQFPGLIDEHNPLVIQLKRDLDESKNRLNILENQKAEFDTALTTISDAKCYHEEVPNG